jgi:hypothetical protein
MSGFGMRLDHFDSVHDPLQLTALYFEYGDKYAWLISADLCQFPDGTLKQQGFDYLTQRLCCERSALFLNASHTHGGPMMFDSCAVASPANELLCSPRNAALVRRYIECLWQNVADACEEARANAMPARLRWAEGKTTFPMNRRALVQGRIRNAPNPDGSFEDRLRLLAVEADGSLMALGLILACHPTSTGPQHQITADYIHGWRRQMRRYVDDDTKLFFLQACGGDARQVFTDNGADWRIARLDELVIMGEHLAKESAAAIKNGWNELTQPFVNHAQRSIALPCEKLPRAAYESLRHSDMYWARDYAENCLRLLEEGETLRQEVPLELTLLALDRELIFLGGDCEFLHGIGRKIEAQLPVRHPVALGYTNGCSGYVPDSEELVRGGYEAESYFWENWSGPFLPQSETEILQGVREMYAQLRL